MAGGWQLNGTAQLNTTASPANLQLTPATNWQAGSAFYPTPVAGVGITASFDAFIGSGSGADGLTFTLADASVTQPTALGVNGGGEGFSGITGFAVSLDTWQNAVNPSNNFVGIANGSVPGAANELNYVATNTSIPPLRNTVHHFVVTTTSTGITVTMDGTQVLNYAHQPAALRARRLHGGDRRVQRHPPGPERGRSRPPVAAAGAHRDRRQPGPGDRARAGPRSRSPARTSPAPPQSTSGRATRPIRTPITSPTTIIATSPTGTGTVDVTVTTPGGTSATSAADQFTYSSPVRPSSRA